MTTPRRVGQSAPYVVIVDGVLMSAHRTILSARSAAAKSAGGKVGMVVHSGNCCTMHNLWSPFHIGQRVAIDANGKVLAS